MLDLVILLAQITLISGIAAWLSTGVWDNIRHPSNNEDFTAEVMEMRRMRAAYPDAFARVAHRAITRRSLQRMAFRLVVLAELAAALILWTGAMLLIASAFGFSDPDTARAIALLGATLFTAVWMGFLIVGNYFCYWFCHEWAQNTHYQMTFWGMGTMIFLVVS